VVNQRVAQYIYIYFPLELIKTVTTTANIIPFFAFPPEIRRVIYTTNAIESMNSSLRKVITSQQIFPSDEAAFKVVYLVMGNISQQWTMPIKDGKPALNRFAILFEDGLRECPSRKTLQSKMSEKSFLIDFYGLLSFFNRND
jgi:hypothetical protein